MAHLRSGDAAASEGRAQGKSLDCDLGVLGGVLDLAAAPGVDEGVGVLAVFLAKRLDLLPKEAASGSTVGSRSR